MTKITKPADAHRAGRFVLAVDADDGPQVAGIIRELTAEPESFLRFSLELAAITIGVARDHIGPDWPQVLGNALLDLELDHLDPRPDADA